MCRSTCSILAGDEGGTFTGLRMLDMTVQDDFMNPFGALFEVQIPFYTRARRKRRER